MKNPELRKPKSFITDSKHVCPLLWSETPSLSSRAVCSVNIFGKVVWNKGQSAPCLQNMQNCESPIENCLQKFISFICLGEQIPVSLTFGLSSVSPQPLHLLGIYSSSGSYFLWGLWFPTFWASTVQTDLILCCRGLPGDFHEGSVPPCSGGSKETAPGRHITIISSVLQFQKDEDKLQAI